MTSSCCTRGGRAAVPYSNLRGAIGTFHAGKSADPSRKVSLPGHFLHREDLRRCPRTHRTGQASQFLHTGDATREFSYQDTDAACYTHFPSEVTLQRSLLARIETLLPLQHLDLVFSCQDRDAHSSTTLLPRDDSCSVTSGYHSYSQLSC